MKANQLAITWSNLTIETLEQGLKYVQHLNAASVFFVNFEHISHLVLVFLWFEQVNASWDSICLWVRAFVKT